MRLSTFAAALLGAALALPVAAQQRALTLDDLYDPEKKLDFSGRPVSGVEWLDDKAYAHFRADEPGAGGGRMASSGEWRKVDALTGIEQPLFDAAKLEAAIARVPGVDAGEAKKLARSRSLVKDAGRQLALVVLARDLWLWRFGADRLTRLTATPGEEHLPSLSPDARVVAFVRDHDLHVVDVETLRERRLTTDGSEQVLNGQLDWVYEEEIFGRGQRRAYWWSPDSAKLAFLRLDEHGVPLYTLVDDMPTRPGVEQWPYPKAGDRNPGVRLASVSVAGGAPVFADLGRYGTAEILIVDVAWAPGSDRLVFQVQDREQTWLDLVSASAKGETKVLLRETTKAWVEPQGSPTWLKDGGFLWFSERSGFKHLYHYAKDASLVRSVTTGEWEAQKLHGVDEKAGLVYFSATERSPIGSDVYSVKLDGSGQKRLSEAAGTHNATFNPSFSQYVDSWSDLSTPTQVRLHAADGKLVRLIDANEVKALAQFRLSKPELLKVKTRDGFEMEAMLIKPPDFDPATKYPVYQQTYGGPHAPQVRDAWGGTGFLYHQLLAQKGIVVWVCDNRTASGKGAVSAWAGYQRLGETELADVEDGIAWLKQQPWVDASRIGINGWSYGGFMVSYALTHSKNFAMGIAGGPVTDWRNYDSVYTERYMKTPAGNPDGYARTAPKAAAKDLHGQLLLIHGAIDDNVHPQNTMQFAYELQKAGKPFQMMLYPKSRHGVTDPRLAKHLRETMLAFIEATLLAPASR
ncbi:MAG: S9 family peptidase [Vicinamibacteria bacterium]|nr:S9 family peptidase [Vicinamibacteria bacterium]